jgi:UDP-glucose 4-epimerase
MNILVTGGAGYIGSILVEHFVKKHSVVILDDLSTGKKELINPKATFIHESILNKKQLFKIFSQYKFDLVIHLAAKTVVSESVKKPKLYHQHNVMGTENILLAMQKTNVKKLIFSSSAAVYGMPSKKIIDENINKKPCNPYGISKLKAEEIIKTSNVNYAILRFFNVAGTSKSLKFGMIKDKPTLLIPATNNLILHNQKPVIYGNTYQTKDGTCIRDYVHVEDLIVACEKIIPRLLKNQSGIYNLGSGKGYSVLEIIQLACKINQAKFIYEIKPKRLGDPDILIASIKLAKKQLS